VIGERPRTPVTRALLPVSADTLARYLIATSRPLDMHVVSRCNFVSDTVERLPSQLSVFMRLVHGELNPAVSS
jgi:hypothetical protein